VPGIDRLLADPGRWLRGRRVALLANQASLASDHRPSVDALAAALPGGLTALLTPEHGASGFEDDATDVPDGRDPRSGLPLVSLYGPRRRPDPELLRGLDTVVVDLRDVGVRCYTYATSVALLLEAAAETGTEVVLCDRPAPLGGRLDGPALEPARRSFLGYLEVPFQHGLTLGELASRHARRLGGAPLRVIAVEGWRRGAPDGGGFVPPSPGLPSAAAVALYPGLVALEGTDLSEGRGTPLPFELVGGPELDGHALARDLNALAPAGVWARPLAFRPDSGKLAGRVCQGVQLHLSDAAAVRPLELGAAVLRLLFAAGKVRWRPSSAMPWAQAPGAGQPWHEPVEGLLVDALLGDDSFRAVAEGRVAFAEASARWAEQHRAFLRELDGDLLYGPAPAPWPSASPSAAGRGAAGGAGPVPLAPRDGGPTAQPDAAGARSSGGRGGPLGLGIDAGGSSLRWRLEGPAGAIAEGRLAPLAGHLYDDAGRSDAAARLSELGAAVAAAVAAAAAGPPTAVVAGVTGLTPAGAEAAWLSRELAASLGLSEPAVTVLDDIELAFRAAFPAADGVLVYAGTGAIAVTRVDGQRIRAGGHGYLLDDDGGGFSIGRAALRSVLREADGAGAAPASGLATQLYRATGGADWDRVRAYVYGGGRGAVAALVPRVAQAAADGDDGARAILAWAGEELGRLARLLLRRCGGARPVALAGGVARVGGALEASFRASLPAGVEVRVLTDEPVQAAARLARASATRGTR
jgi:uncharacterized protein YbbC (DUF1343 family)/N-acetylglucosamine kinase-like BadF-type ATPase